MPVKSVTARSFAMIAPEGCWPARAMAALALLALPIAPAAAGDDKAVLLSPHRAVYDLSLAESQGPRAVAGVSGRIAYELSGDACTGYSLEFRQLAIIERSEGPAEQIDMRTATHEDADGSSFRFRMDTAHGDRPSERVEGVARQLGEGAGIVVDLAEPEPHELKIPGAIAFPSGHLQQIIRAGRAQQSSLDYKLYDAGEDGSRVFDTFVVIGKRQPASPERELEEAARQAGLDKVDRWPVSVSYYAPGTGERTPVYAISFDLYDNGISGSLRMNYGDFTIKGALKALEQYDGGECIKE